MSQGPTRINYTPATLVSLGVTASAADLNLVTGASKVVVQYLYSQTGAVATGTTAIPWDDTIPQITEGVEFMTLAITPKNVNNILVFEIVFNAAASVASDVLTVALFQGSTANALAATGTSCYTNTGTPFELILRHSMLAGTTSSTTFRVRAGITAGATLTFNGAGGARKYGSVMASSISVTEYTP